MIDEEMAEEYVDTLMNKDDSELDKFLDENLGDLKLTSKQAGVLLGIIKGVGINSFLAGLKVGRPKWHKVAEGDLPDENAELILVRDRWKNHFLNYHFLLNKMIVEMIDQFDEWVELPIEE